MSLSLILSYFAQSVIIASDLDVSVVVMKALLFCLTAPHVRQQK